MISIKIKIILPLLVIGVFGFSIYFVLTKSQIKERGQEAQKEVVETNIAELPKSIQGVKKMILILGGNFLMGEENSNFSDERPAHFVTIDSFYMDETPVTYRDFEKYIEAGGAKPKYWEYETYNLPENPVTGINWYHAVDYCNWRSVIEGILPNANNAYRLPTEAEFEYAARGGLEGKKFPWGNEFDSSLANYDDERGIMKGDWWRLAKVKDTPPNNYGLYGMSGNIWHWTNDWYDENYYRKSPKNNPTGPVTGKTKVLRGGSWGSISPDYLRVAKRSYTTPNNYNYDIGFRCVRSAKGTILENPKIDEKTQYQFYQYKTYSENKPLEDLYGDEFLNRLTEFIADNYPNSIYFQTKIDGQDIITPKQMAKLIIDTTKEYNINPLFLAAIMASESGFGTVSFPRWYNNPMAYHWQNVLMENGLPTYEPLPFRNRKYINLETGFREFAKGIRRDIYINAAKKDLDAFHLLYVGYRANEWMHTITRIYNEVLGIRLEPHFPINNIGEYIYTDWNKTKTVIPSEEEKIRNKLSLEEKIGQLFIIGFEGKKLTPEIENLLKTINPGGVILFSRNIEEENQLKKLINDIQKISLENNGLALFVAIDQEGEPIRRIKWLKDEISQAEIKNTEGAYQVGLKRGKDLKKFGINLNLAPVLDITQAGDFLHNRSFRGSPEEVGALARGLISGQKEASIFTCVKHFPGYGGISFNPETDSMPILEKTPEIFQFQKAFEVKPELIMTANVIYSEIDKNLPFTLSPKGIQFLKTKVKDAYLIISDDLSSKILKEKFTLKKSVILAKKAGVDILLVAGWKQPEDPLEAFAAVLEATKNGEIQEENINESVLKIIRLKQKILLETTDKTNQQKIENNKESATTSKKSSQPSEKDNLDKPLNIINKLVAWGYEIPSLSRFIDTIIIHSSYDAWGNDPHSVEGVMYEYKIYGVSPHYLIDREGTVFQLVKEENIAYHAGNSRMPDGRTNINSFSIGIELINTKNEEPNDAQYSSLVKLVKSIKSRYQIKYILGHNEIAPGRKTDPWNFDWQRFNSELAE